VGVKSQSRPLAVQLVQSSSPFSRVHLRWRCLQLLHPVRGFMARMDKDSHESRLRIGAGKRARNGEVIEGWLASGMPTIFRACDGVPARTFHLAHYTCLAAGPQAMISHLASHLALCISHFSRLAALAPSAAGRPLSFAPSSAAPRAAVPVVAAIAPAFCIFPERSCSWHWPAFVTGSRHPTEFRVAHFTASDSSTQMR